jgi:hypothetical protein
MVSPAQVELAGRQDALVQLNGRFTSPLMLPGHDMTEVAISMRSAVCAYRLTDKFHAQVIPMHSI